MENESIQKVMAANPPLDIISIELNRNTHLKDSIV